MNHIVKYNEMSEWQKDIRGIYDIIGHIKTYDDIDKVTVVSKVKYSIPKLKLKLVRTTDSANSGHDAQYDFCDHCQEAVDRIVSLGHKVDVSLVKKRTLANGHTYPEILNIKNPIEYAYHDKLDIWGFEIEISDKSISLFQRWKNFRNKK